MMFTFFAIVVLAFLMGGHTGGKGNRPDEEGTLDVVLVGSGLPKKGMGWYHLTQLLEMKNVNVKAVVEPFFLNQHLCPNPPASFTEFVRETTDKGVKFVSSVDALDHFVKPTLCLIAGRTADNPSLFTKCVEKGATCIFLEKPGAPSVKELKQMESLAYGNSVRVYIGYNKNVTPYVKKALEFSKSVASGAQVVFQHNNSYKENELPECFERNAEGMLKNMAIHELALLVTFFGVTVDTIKEFKVLKGTTKLTLTGPSSGKSFTDFKEVAFEVTTTKGKSVTVRADRCGGNVSFASVQDAKGKEMMKFEFPDVDEQKKVDELTKADPEMMPYFFVQSDDYDELKTRVVNSCLEDKQAEGVATIKIAIEALKLAEYGTEKLMM